MKAILLAVVAALVLGVSVRAEDALVGFYDCKGLNPNGKAYTGTVQIIQTGDTFHMRWLMPGPNGETEEIIGVALKNKDVLIVAYAAGDRPGLGRYTIKGKTLDGEYTVVGSENRWKETLTRLDKAPALAPHAPPHAHDEHKEHVSK